MFFKYNKESNNLESATHSVKTKDWEILSNKYKTYKYPYHGWYWFENDEEAKKFFNIKTDNNNEF